MKNMRFYFKTKRTYDLLSSPSFSPSLIRFLCFKLNICSESKYPITQLSIQQPRWQPQEDEEFFLEGLYYWFYYWVFKILGEFPVAEGSSRNLVSCLLPRGIPSKTIYQSDSWLWFLDYEEMREFIERNREQSYLHKNYGYLNNFNWLFLNQTYKWRT